MGSLNKATLIGNLGADPESRCMPDGTQVSTISLATTEAWKDRASGEKKEKTEWHRVVFFGAVAEVVRQHLKKGSQVYVEGKLRTRKWVDKNGVERYTTEVVGRELVMLGKKDTKDLPAKPAEVEPPNQDSMDDDIPF